MKYQAVDVSTRIENLKQTYKTFPVPATKDSYHPVSYRPYRSGDRYITLGFLRGYKKHNDALTARLRTSYAEAEELYESQPIICDDELLLGHLYLPDFTDEEQAEYDALCDDFDMSPHTLLERAPRKDHLCLDFEKLLKVGISGLKKEINEKLNGLDMLMPKAYPDLEEIKKWEFYNCCLIELEAVSDLAQRYSKAAYAAAEEKEEPRKSELLRLSDMLKKVPEFPAENFYEAVQSVHLFLSTLFGLYPLGRPDRYLYDFYKRDIENGTITKEFAQELIDNFCLGVSDRVFTRAACGFIVGGRDKYGNVTENELTYMFLTALDHLKLPDPNGALAVCSDTSEDLIEYGIEILSHGTSHPAFYNDEVIRESLIKNYGVDREDAADYIHSTCAEISVIGKSKPYSTSGVINLPRLLLEVTKSGEYTDFSCLFEEYINRLKASVKASAQHNAVRMMEAARVGNEAMRICALIDNCIERGKGIYEGGEKYMFEQPIFVGFATAVDSLTSIMELVYKEKKLTLNEFVKIVEKDFEGQEDLRQYILNKIPHYGNGEKLADDMAEKLAESLQGIFYKNVVLWDNMMPGTFSYITHATLGGNMGATFDGRRAGRAFSDGCGPVQGRDVNGITALIGSLTSWDQSALLGGMVVNLKFTKKILEKETYKSIAAIIRTFMKRGGIELQINTVDRATLEDAVKNPELHSELLVRVGGYSDYFVRLSPTLQKEIIDRTEY